MHSPWGAVQTATELAPGITSVTTASHGGIKLSAARYAKMPKAFKSTPYSSGGWYEEDCDWAMVAVTFPEAFSAEAVQAAKRTIAFTYPELGEVA
jgi:hypothetical protein